MRAELDWDFGPWRELSAAGRRAAVERAAATPHVVKVEVRNGRVRPPGNLTARIAGWGLPTRKVNLYLYMLHTLAYLVELPDVDLYFFHQVWQPLGLCKNMPDPIGWQ